MHFHSWLVVVGPKILNLEPRYVENNRVHISVDAGFLLGTIVRGFLGVNFHSWLVVALLLCRVNVDSLRSAGQVALHHLQGRRIHPGGCTGRVGHACGRFV